MEIKANTQVVWKKQLRGNLNQMCVGTVVAMSVDGKKADVSFPAERVRRTVPLTELRAAGDVYGGGRARVDYNSGRRLVDFLRQ